MEGLRFDNRALRELPVAQAPATTGDRAGGGRVSAAAATGACYVLVSSPPAPLLPGLRLLLHSPSALELLGIDPADVEQRPDAYASALLLGGGGGGGGGGGQRGGSDEGDGSGAATPPSRPPRLAPGAELAAHIYAGHQHACFAGLLGDGAALYLGEVVVAGDRRLELNLEGAGPTPLSRRRAVGRATAAAAPTAATAATGRKSLLQAAREMLLTEALAALGVPTTRAALLGYCPRTRCATVLRLAPSFLRVGSLEICRPAQAGAAAPRAGPSAAPPGPWEVLPRLLDHAIRRHYPEVWRAFGGGGGNYGEGEDAERAAAAAGAAAAGGGSGSIGAFPPHTAGRRRHPLPPFHLASDLEARGEMVAASFGELCARLGRTCALWQAAGFAHGAPSSDNLALSGDETINAGARGSFLGRADRAFSASPLDESGRYSFGAQASAVRFALERLAEALGSASALAAAGVTATTTAAGAVSAGAASLAARAAGDGNGGHGGGGDDHDAAAASAFSSLAMPGGMGPGRARRELARFDAEYDAAYCAAMRRKLGLLLLPASAASHHHNAVEVAAAGPSSAAAAAAAAAAAPGVEAASASSAADDRSLVEALLLVMEATGADYARTMRRLSMVPMRLEGPGRQQQSAADDDADDGGANSGNDAFGGFLSSDFLDTLPSPLVLADAIAASLPLEANVRALVALTRRDAAFSFALGVPAEQLERLAARHRAASALRATAAAAGGGAGGRGAAAAGDGGASRKRADDVARWSGWLARYARRLALEARAAAAAPSAAQAAGFLRGDGSGGGGGPSSSAPSAPSPAEVAVQRAAAARRVAMYGPGGNPSFVLREEDLKEAVAAAEEGGGGDGGAALRVLLERVRRPFS